MAAIIKIAHVWGVKEPKELKGFPEGKIRLRIRNNAFAKVFVKTSDGIISYIVKEENGYWIPSHEQGRNQTS